MQIAGKKMHITHGFSLRKLNTFGLEVVAENYVSVENDDNLKEISQHPLLREGKFLVLGGGSNILFRSKQYHGLVIHLQTKGIEVINETNQYSVIRVAAGENWHEFVLGSLDMNLGGLENLSLIPGNVGAAPMQNIGAYGVEIKDVFHSLKALNLNTAEIETFDRDACQFGYRSSVFKTSLKNRYIILSVDFKLDKNHTLKTDYGSLQQEIAAMNARPVDIKTVSEAVCRIRSAKLPDPKYIGNAGSFFKNPVVSETLYHQIKHKYPGLVAFPDEGSRMKLAAGWLIEQAGWKGYRRGQAGVHNKQALVLVNHGHASGEDILSLAREIQSSVFDTFGVQLETEVNIIE